MRVTVAIAAILVSLAGASAASGAKAKSELIVRTASGQVRGDAKEGGRRWLGIPYAAPPVQELRWMPPQQPVGWRGVRSASRLRPACLQSTTEYDEHRGSEDCLYLNIFAPGRRAQGTLPVMVWLHGGGFINGSGGDFDGARLATTGQIIVVTINYRLGPFGWLALDSLSKEQGGASGNYGLYDQLAALKWIRSNIRGFGGDPTRVTLAGQSAGGESVLAQTASPLASGLFQRAIAQSAPAALSLPTVAAASSRNQSAYATELGCADAATQLACLRAVPAERALAAGHETWDLLKALGLYWTPVVGVPSLPDQWLNRFRAGTFNKVPIMIGHTAHEGRLFVAIFENSNGHAMTAQEYLDRGIKFFSVATPLVAALYNPVLQGSAGASAAAVITDALFACGENRDRDALDHQGAPAVYSYEFADPHAFDVEVHGKFTPIGDGHDSDLPFLFQYNHGRLGPNDPPFSDPQRALAAQVGRYWGNFARSGDPNEPGLPLWPAFVAGTSTPTQLLTPPSSSALTAGAYYQNHQCDFWYMLLGAQEATK